MNIAVTAIGYECAEHMEKVLKPWNDLRSEGYQIFISVAHGVFPEVAQLGCDSKSKDGTISLLNKMLDEEMIDSLVIKDFPTKEKDLRNATLPFLFEKGFDLLWLLDLQDEIYTAKEILSIIKYIESKPESHWFKINFKNYVIDESTYIDDFIVPRVWRNGVNKGVAGFLYDNDIIFKSGQIQTDAPYSSVPRETAFPKHLSWVGSSEYLKRKIEFQKIHYGFCSYEWDEISNKLKFSENYYKMVDKPIPTLFKD